MVSEACPGSHILSKPGADAGTKKGARRGPLRISRTAGGSPVGPAAPRRLLLLGALVSGHHAGDAGHPVAFARLHQPHALGIPADHADFGGHDALNQFSPDDLATWQQDMAKLSGVRYSGISMP